VSASVVLYSARAHACEPASRPARALVLSFVCTLLHQSAQSAPRTRGSMHARIQRCRCVCTADATWHNRRDSRSTRSWEREWHTHDGTRTPARASTNSRTCTSLVPATWHHAECYVLVRGAPCCVYACAVCVCMRVSVCVCVCVPASARAHTHAWSVRGREIFYEVVFYESGTDAPSNQAQPRSVKLMWPTPLFPLSHHTYSMRPTHRTPPCAHLLSPPVDWAVVALRATGVERPRHEFAARALLSSAADDLIMI